MQEHLTQRGNKSTCPVAVIIRDGKLLMGHRHYTKDVWKDISVWTCPGGRCDVEETIEETLRREVEEETGITDLKIVDYVGESKGAKEGDVVPIFLCTTAQEPRLMEPEKFSEWRWMDVQSELEDTLRAYNPYAYELLIRFLGERT